MEQCVDFLALSPLPLRSRERPAPSAGGVQAFLEGAAGSAPGAGARGTGVVRGRDPCGGSGGAPGEGTRRPGSRGRLGGPVRGLEGPAPAGDWGARAGVQGASRGGDSRDRLPGETEGVRPCGDSGVCQGSAPWGGGTVGAPRGGLGGPGGVGFPRGGRPGRRPRPWRGGAGPRGAGVPGLRGAAATPRGAGEAMTNARLALALEFAPGTGARLWRPRRPLPWPVRSSPGERLGKVCTFPPLSGQLFA